MEQKKLQAAIEAILFAMGGSVELKKLAQAIGHDEETTKKIIRQMMDRYEKEEFLRRFSVHSLDELPAPNPEQVAHFKEEAEDEVQLKLNL